MELAFLSNTAVTPLTRGLGFPVGARFPRRTEPDAAAYLTELASRGTTSTHMAYPVGDGSRGGPTNLERPQHNSRGADAAGPLY